MENKELELMKPEMQEEQKKFKCPQCQFAAVCGDCYGSAQCSVYNGGK